MPKKKGRLSRKLLDEWVAALVETVRLAESGSGSTERKMLAPAEPTPEECSNTAKVFDDKHHVAHALWYPQMGGYVGKAVAVFTKDWDDHANLRVGGCIDVYVWHDGEFPFGEDEQPPRALHHCEPTQFIELGEILSRLNERYRRKKIDA